MPVVDIHVQLGQQRSRIVRPADRAELVIEQPRPALLQESLQSPQVFRIGDTTIRLLRLGTGLLVIGKKVEGTVPQDGTAQGRTHLIAVELGLATSARLGERSGNLVPLAEVVCRSIEIVGARFGDHVDEAPCGASELGGGTLIDHH